MSDHDGRYLSAAEIRRYLGLGAAEAEVARLRAIAKAFSEMSWERDLIAAEVCPRVGETVLAAVMRVVRAELRAREALAAARKEMEG